MARTKTKSVDMRKITPFDVYQRQSQKNHPDWNPELDIKPIEYTKDEGMYRSFVLKRLTDAMNLRESIHDEFNGVNYTTRYINNFKGGLSYQSPRKNPEETSIVTGTTREKKLAIVNAVLNLVFETAFRAFDEDNIEDQELGESFTDLVFQANKMELWEEKKIFVYSELADQGDVFVQDMWVDEVKMEKTKIKISEITEETFKNFDPNKGIQKIVYSGPRRRVIPGPQVFLGNVRECDIHQQPYIASRFVISYEEAKGIYGHLPRFKNVPRQLQFSNPVYEQSFGLNWRLLSVAKDFVEVIIYEDRHNDEFQILLNGVMMLPVKFPMPWGHGEYSITQGHLEPISAFFAYSKSVPDKTKLDQEIIDEMYRLAVLKTQKSFMPPIANYSAQILTKDMFLPGKINNNLEKGEIEVMGGDPRAYSVQPAEFQMIQMIKQFINEKSVSPILSGAGMDGKVSATQYSSMVQQAKVQLGVMIFGFMNLHLRLDYLRLQILLDNYTKETKEKVNEINGKLERKFKAITVGGRQIGDRGIGNKKIEFTEEPVSGPELYDLEEGIKRDPETGKSLSKNPPKEAIKITQIKPSTLRSIRYRWFPEVKVSEKDTSLAAKISYEDRLVKAAQLFGVQSINWDYAKQQWSVKNDINPDYFFASNVPMPANGIGGPPAEGSSGAQEQVNSMQESAMNKVSRSQPTGEQAAMRQGMGA
jgi:hypothetical protein